MADLEKLSLEVEATSSDATKEVDGLAQSLKNLQASLSGLDTKKLSGMTSGLASIKNTVQKSGLSASTKQIKEQTKALTNLSKVAAGTKGAFGAGFKGVKSQITGVFGAMKLLNNAFGLGRVTSGKFLTSLARIAGYRAVRTIISGVTKSASTGLKNLAAASSEANATLTQLSNGVKTLQNAMGGALYSVIASIVSLLNTVINAAVTAINWISMLFAILGGRSTFMQAKTKASGFAGALSKAGEEARSLKQELMGFDEINSLTPNPGGGGGGTGGGGAGMLDYGSMFEETPVDQSLLEMVQNADFTLLGQALADKINAALANVDWSRIQSGAYKLAKSLVTFLNGFIRRVDASIIGESIAGLVNTGLTFVNTFFYGTEWNTLGEKVKEAIIGALKGVSPEDIGKAVAAKLYASVEYFRGLLPSSGEEWREITDWISRSIIASVEAIEPTYVGDIVASVITGGLELIKSLGNANVFVTIAEAIAEAIKKAISSISEEDIRDAAVVLLEQAIGVLKVALDLVIEISNTTLGKALTGYGLYRLFKGGMAGLGLKGFKSTGTSLQMMGSLVFAFEAVAGINDLLSDISAGNGISFNKLANGVIAPAFKAAGIAIMKIAPHAAGVLLTIGVGIDLVNIFANLDVATAETYTEDMFNGALEPAIQAASSIGELKAVFEQFTGIKLDMSQFEAALKTLSGSDDVVANIDSLKTALIEMFAAYGYLGQGQNATDFFSTILTNAGVLSGATTTIENATAAISGATEGVTDGFANMPTVVDVPKPADDVATSYDTVAASMQATGAQAETLAAKIVEIPSDIVYNLELNNFDTVIGQFDTLASTMGTSASTGVSRFKLAFVGLPNWFSTGIVNPLKSKVTGINWYSIGNKMMGDFKRGMKSVKLPKIKVDWKLSSRSASILGKKFSISIPLPTLAMYAKGGFPNAGELFMANEAGPELVGRIGNQPAVANQDQIGDAIFKYMDAHSAQGEAMNYDSMANALVRAMKSAGLGALYLDGKMIKQSLNREAQRSGKPIVGY